MQKFALIFFAGTLSLVSASLGSSVFPLKFGSSEEQAAALILSDINLPASKPADLPYLDLLSVLNNAVVVASDPRGGTSTINDVDIEAELSSDPTTVSLASLKEATVRIRCTQQGEGYRRIASGTGFIINETGVILTNAHVAQFLLLKKAPNLGDTTCVATLGESAEEDYSINLLYISPTWLLKHASLIATEAPKGTGESDFALVYVSGRADGSSVNQKFSYLPAATSPLPKSHQDKVVTLIGYPKLTDEAAQQLLATTTITSLYTFGSGYADIFSLAPSTLGHNGASGGPVIDEYGRAIGVLTTKDAGTTILNAITMAHVDRQLLEETGFDLASYLSGNLSYKAELFNKTISPIFQEILSQHLNDQ